MDSGLKIAEMTECGSYLDEGERLVPEGHSRRMPLFFAACERRLQRIELLVRYASLFEVVAPMADRFSNFTNNALAFFAIKPKAGWPAQGIFQGCRSSVFSNRHGKVEIHTDACLRKRRHDVIGWRKFHFFAVNEKPMIPWMVVRVPNHDVEYHTAKKLLYTINRYMAAHAVGDGRIIPTQAVELIPLYQ